MSYRIRLANTLAMRKFGWTNYLDRRIYDGPFASSTSQTRISTPRGKT